MRNNQLTSFSSEGLGNLTQLYLTGNRLRTIHVDGGLQNLRHAIGLSFSDDADVGQLRFVCDAGNTPRYVRESIIKALLETNSRELQDLGTLMAEKYMEGRGTIARLSNDTFDVERLKEYSESFPTTLPSDAACMYWKAQLGGVDDAGQSIAAKIQHIFDMADSDDPQDRGVFYLPGSACRSAAIALTALHEHFERLRTDTGTAEAEAHVKEKEKGCIGRVKEAFAMCQSNQAPTLQNELEVAGLTRPKVATLDGFIKYAVVELKRHCAGIAIAEALGIRVEAGAHQYSRALRILDGYFRVGGTIPGFQESWSQANPERDGRTMSWVRGSIHERRAHQAFCATIEPQYEWKDAVLCADGKCLGGGTILAVAL